MGVKGSWSRVEDRDAYWANMEAIQANEKRRRERMERALAVTGGRVKGNKQGKDDG